MVKIWTLVMRLHTPEGLVTSFDDQVFDLRHKIDNMAEVGFICCCHIGGERILEAVGERM